MRIVHKIDDFLFIMFPDLVGGGNDQIISKLEKFYTYGPYKPKVSISDGWVTIEIDTPTILSQETDYRKVVALCEKRKYSEAKKLLDDLIKKNPANSEYHRIYGQILSDEGAQDEAINSLIDALRWDSKNGWALLMMGNIFAKYKHDIPTALKYYDQALKTNPNDNIAINNIGANLMQQGKTEEAKRYFYEALKIKRDYPNTHFALAMIAEMENDLPSAFSSAIESIKLNKNKDMLYQNSVKQALEIAKRIVQRGDGEKIVKGYLHKLEFEGGTEIELIEDTKILTAAKFELAENYNRKNHVIRYKPDYPAGEHLIMHELAHLELIIEARKDNLNLLFISTQENKAKFIKGLEATIRKFHKMGIAENAIANYCSSLFEGMNRQIYNTPIDLFIENLIYHEYAELRPYQFLSLFSLIQEGLTAVTDKKIVDHSPKDILSKSKIYNMVNAIQFKELYGIDLIRDFHASPLELKQALSFYDEYAQCKNDRIPAKEYKLVLRWAKELQLDEYFELVNEREYRTKRTAIDNHLESTGKGSYELESKDLRKRIEVDKFQKTQESMGINMAVVMFMVGAIQYFEGMPKKEIKKIAFEIAMQGTQGYRPDKNDYTINSIPGKIFSGYQILAYYYVSWSLAIPEMVERLQLPYEEEYKLALTMSKTTDK